MTFWTTRILNVLFSMKFIGFEVAGRALGEMHEIELAEEIQEKASKCLKRSNL